MAGSAGGGVLVGSSFGGAACSASPPEEAIGAAAGPAALTGSRLALWLRSTVGYSIWRAGRVWIGSSIFQEKASSERGSKLTVWKPSGCGIALPIGRE